MARTKKEQPVEEIKTAEETITEEITEEVVTEADAEEIPAEEELAEETETSDVELAEPEDVPAEESGEGETVSLDDTQVQETAETPAQPARNTDTRARSSSRAGFQKVGGRGRQVIDEELVGEQGEGLTKMSRSAARRAYRNKEEVFTINPEKAATKSDSEILHDTYIDLAASFRGQTAREGIISKVTRIGEGEGVVAAVVLYGGYQVIIPASNLFIMNPRNIRENDSVQDVQHFYASLRIGSTVKFVVRSIDEGARTAYASRLLAMEKESYQYYVEEQSDGEPYIKEGMIVEATVTYVTQSGIGVDVFGSETFIYPEELQWLTTSDVAAENYNIGDVIKVKVLGVRPVDVKIGNTTFHLIETDVSAKQATEDPNKKYFDYFNVGDKCQAEIIMVTDRGYVVRLMGLRDAMCGFANSRVLTVGTVVNVKITQKREDGYKIFGNIRQIIKENY